MAHRGGLTEGSRLEKNHRCGVFPRFGEGGTFAASPACMPIPPVHVQSSGMYTENLKNVYGISTWRGVSQDRVAQLLASAATRRTATTNAASSEGVRIQQLQASYEPGAVNGPPIGSSPAPIVVTVCPPLPAPPAPPARACVLAKNERF
jgi:hypothetical protein